MSKATSETRPRYAESRGCHDREVITVDKNATIKAAARMMDKNRISCFDCAEKVCAIGTIT
jgi:predicted transcriptional regulator